MSRTYRRIVLSVVIAGFTAAYTVTGVAGPQRSIVELFTSQGCSSCPPADALLGRLSTDPALLALSFHVNYWNSIGWKDPFSSQVVTDRQYAYAHALGERTVFTPQLIVNGTRSLIGSQEGEIRKEIAKATEATLPVSADLAKQADGSFNLQLAGPAVAADVWEVRYVRRSVTKIRAGENGGRELETFNDVVQLHRLGAFQPGVLKLEPLRQPADGLAVLVQKPSGGPILGVAAY
ncbi:MAG: DUF1223 domain-containing protein [Sinobacteraceae bacterium]|nr:DUF1223 domain-containing protein [Nevskiaceae bacterium]